MILGAIITNLNLNKRHKKKNPKGNTVTWESKSTIKLLYANHTFHHIHKVLCMVVQFS